MPQRSERELKTSAGDQIAEAIRALILSGKLTVDERLPGEQELAARFGVSRPTVREALKRLAAQNLIRTRRGATGGNFVNRIGFDEAEDQLISTTTLLMSMTPLPADTVVEARLTLLGSAAPLACARREQGHLDIMHSELALQRSEETDDIAFCASDVRFHRALVDAAQNPLLSFHLAGVIEAIQPLLNMITYRGRDRDAITARHERIIACLQHRDHRSLQDELRLLSDYTARLVEHAQTRRSSRSGQSAAR